MPSEPGKCYAKCLVPHVFETEQIEYFEFLGSYEGQSFVEAVEHVIVPSTERWEKRKKNGFDVWCLVASDPEVQNLYNVIDTSQTDLFRIITLEQKSIVEQGGFTDWTEVLCEGDQNSKLFEQLHASLLLNGFESEFPVAGKWTESLKQALVDYQNKHSLRVGGLSIETLDHLGVNY